MLRLRVKSSLSALRTAVMSAFTSSRLMMSSTRVELMFTLADWPFALAWKMKRGKEEKAVREERRRIIPNQAAHIHANRTTEAALRFSPLTFCLLGGVEPGACSGVAGGVGVRERCTDPGGGHEGRPDLSHQQRSQQVQVIQSHNCQKRGARE